MASNTDEKIISICESDGFKDFPTEELGDCFEYGKEVHSKINAILMCIMIVAIAVTILLELRGRWEYDSEKVAMISKNPLTSFGRKN